MSTASKTTTELLQGRAEYAYYKDAYGRSVYVAQLPSKGKGWCQDWGYTRNPRSQDDPAIRLGVYWQQRFAANCRRLNREALFTAAV